MVLGDTNNSILATQPVSCTEHAKKIAENLSRVNERLAAAAERSGRSPDTIALVAVTKGRSVMEIETAIAAGVANIGENRVQEAQQKYHAVGDKTCRWHLIGHLQRNKVKTALQMFSLIHSVDSVRLFAEIARRSETHRQQTDVLIQVNTTGEASKYGVHAADVPRFIEQSLGYPAVRILGLMTIGQLDAPPATNRKAFALLRTVAEKIEAQQFPDVIMRYLSMGMTNDFEIAIEEGANLVRIGRAIFL